MKFFVDSGTLADIKRLVPLGIVDGVTTNPSLLAKEPRDPREIIKEICQVVQGPVSYEVVATDAAGMIAEGRQLASIDQHVVVKVPFTRDGVEATRTLAAEGAASRGACPGVSPRRSWRPTSGRSCSGPVWSPASATACSSAT